MLVRPPMTNFKMTVRADYTFSARNLLLCLQKLLPTDCPGRVGVGGRQVQESVFGGASSVPRWLPAFRKKEKRNLSYPPTWPPYWLFRGNSQTWFGYIAAAAKLLQSCPTLCDPIDGSPPGFPVPRILQARTLEWVAISFSNS